MTSVEERLRVRERERESSAGGLHMRSLTDVNSSPTPRRLPPDAHLPWPSATGGTVSQQFFFDTIFFLDDKLLKDKFFCCWNIGNTIDSDMVLSITIDKLGVFITKKNGVKNAQVQVCPSSDLSFLTKKCLGFFLDRGGSGKRERYSVWKTEREKDCALLWPTALSILRVDKLHCADCPPLRES